MKSWDIWGVLSLLALGILCACGVPGVPLPPSLNLPQPVSDLAATRKANEVTLTWTVPRETTDRATLKHLGTTRICRSAGPQPMTRCEQEIGKVAASAVPKSAKLEFADTLPAGLQQEDPTGVVRYAIETDNDDGRTAGLSNQATAPLAPTLPPPTNAHAQVTPAAIDLSLDVASAPALSGLAYSVRAYRQVKSENAAPVVINSPPQSAVGGRMQLSDPNFEWEKTYVYRFAIVTDVTEQGTTAATVEGAQSAPLEVFAHDIFPPAAPSGVQAVYTPPVAGQRASIDLTWTPNTESDLAGYNVYRRETGGVETKITTELLQTPAFRDTSVEPGKTYFYSISAVDLRGNESERSAETSESVPRD